MTKRQLVRILSFHTNIILRRNDFIFIHLEELIQMVFVSFMVFFPKGIVTTIRRFTHLHRHRNRSLFVIFITLNKCSNGRCSFSFNMQRSAIVRNGDNRRVSRTILQQSGTLCTICTNTGEGILNPYLSNQRFGSHFCGQTIKTVCPFYHLNGFISGFKCLGFTC